MTPSFKKSLSVEPSGAPRHKTINPPSPVLVNVKEQTLKPWETACVISKAPWSAVSATSKRKLAQAPFSQSLAYKIQMRCSAPV